MRQRLYRLLWLPILVISACASALAVAGARRPAWFTVGGELVRSEDDEPSFGPLVWKRRCSGFTWHEWKQGAAWLGCVGWPSGARLQYRSFAEAQEWVVPSVPTGLDAVGLSRELTHSTVERAAVLSWRRRGSVDEALLAAKSSGETWKLSRICLPRKPYLDLPPDSPRLRILSLDSLEVRDRPTSEELRRFVVDSGWAVAGLTPGIERWGVDAAAWHWVSNDSAEVTREIARLKSYTPPSYDSTAAEARGVAAEWASVGFQLAPDRAAVLPEHLAVEVARQCSRGGVPEFESTWTPTSGDIRELEQRLPVLNGTLNRMVARVELCKALRGPTLNDYHRQYSGMVERGRRLIYINALHSGLVHSDWRTRALGVCDGGPAAWGVVYDPATGEFSRFAINGLA